jgi:mannose-6-phosphate isomerase-like protein (cupin superfamily)
MTKPNEKAKVPSHHGRYPFPPEEKRPALLTEAMRMPRMYGYGQNFIPTFTCASTDRIHVSTFTVLPGKYFDPPDIHVGDEVYYLLQGSAHLFNPESGEVGVAHKGDFVLVPAGTWHQVWNFADEEVVIINWIAPQLWSDKARGTSIIYDKPTRYYKGEAP